MRRAAPEFSGAALNFREGLFNRLLFMLKYKKNQIRWCAELKFGLSAQEECAAGGRTGSHPAPLGAVGTGASLEKRVEYFWN